MYAPDRDSFRCSTGQNPRLTSDTVALRAASVRVDADAIHDGQQLDVFPIDVEGGHVKAEGTSLIFTLQTQFVVDGRIGFVSGWERRESGAITFGPPGRNPLATRA